MLELAGTRFRTGYSAHGPPPMAVYELRFDPTSDERLMRERIRSLATHGFDANVVDDEEISALELARCLGSLVGQLLERGGHHAGQPYVRVQNGPEDRIVVELACEETETASSAAEVAAEMLFGPTETLDSGADRMAAFLDFAGARMPHPDTRAIIRAARTRRLPVLRLDQPPFDSSATDRPFRAGLIQLGHGARRRVLAGSLPAPDPARLARVADRGMLVTHLLAHGLPLPPQSAERIPRNRASRAVQTADRLGGPVSLRALYRQPFAHARPSVGPFESLAGPRQVSLAYEAAAGAARQVWLESHVAGKRVRCLVIGGVLVAATRSVPPTITGDGERSVAELIAERMLGVNSPRQRHAWRTLQAGDPDVRARLEIAGQSYRSIPDSGVEIALRGDGTAFNAGTLEAVLPALSTSIRRLAERAAAVCELDTIAAVDLALVDAGGDASPPNCHVLDVIPDPDLASHIECCPELESRLPERLVEVLFPPGRSGRIPTVAVTGTNGKTTTSRMTAAILRRAFGHVGLATTEGAFVNDERVLAGDVAGVAGAATILADDRVEAAVLETARGDLQSVGTAAEVVDAAACLNIASDHIGIDGIDSLDELAAIKARVLALADGHAIVNADDPRCRAMLPAVERARPILVSRRPESQTVRDHLVAGGKAVLIAPSDHGDECLVLAQGPSRTELMRTHDIPATMDGLLPINAENAAAAAALCWSLDVDPNHIRDGLSRFSNTAAGNPGRYNFIDGHPFTLLTDFAQNAHGLAALYSVIGKLPVSGRRRLVCLTIGSRHREHIDEAAVDFVERFDQLIIGCSEYADENPQFAGDDPREAMLSHFRRQLLEAGARADTVETHADPEAAIRRGLAAAQPGDLLVILGSPKVVLPMLEQGTNA